MCQPSESQVPFSNTLPVNGQAQLCNEWISWDLMSGMWPKQEKAVAEILQKTCKQRKDLRNLWSAEDANKENNGNDRSRAPKDLAERAHVFNSSMAGFLDIRTNNANRSLPPLLGLICINAPPCTCKLSLSLHAARTCGTQNHAASFLLLLSHHRTNNLHKEQRSLNLKLVKRRIEEARTANDTRDEIH
jgi:hypothetical protein